MNNKGLVFLTYNVFKIPAFMRNHVYCHFLSLTFKLLTNLSQEFVRLGNTVSVNNTFFGQLGTLEKEINRKNYTLNFINNKNSNKLPYYTLNFINNKNFKYRVSCHSII